MTISKPISLFAALLLFGIQWAYSQSEREVKSFYESVRPTYDICFTPDGKSLAATSGNIINIIDPEKNEVIRKYETGHSKDILTIDISSDGRLIASGGKDGKVIIRSLETGAITGELNRGPGVVVTCVRFSPTGDYIYTADTKGNVSFYNASSGAIVFDKKLHHKIVSAIDVSPDGRLLVSAGSDGKAYLIDALSGDINTELAKGNGWLRDIAFSPDGHGIIAGGDRGRTWLWELNKDDSIIDVKTGKVSKKWILGVDYLKMDTIFAYTGMDMKIHIDIVADLYTFDAGSFIYKIRFKPQSDPEVIVAAATNDKGVIFKKASEMKIH